MTIIATAAWAIPQPAANRFSEQGSGLTRYASVFNGVEINSTFHRRHRPSTFARWADSVPDSFRFSVKLPQEITHVRAMREIAEPFEGFLQDIVSLGEKRGPLLCQLPPSLAFNAEHIETAFKAMRSADTGQIVIEVRHKSWKSDEAANLLRAYRIDPVLADPSVVWTVEDFAVPPRYVRLHGRPKIYYSSYTSDELRAFSDLLAPGAWCVFDNTASGAAGGNALEMLDLQQAARRLPLEARSVKPS